MRPLFIYTNTDQIQQTILNHANYLADKMGFVVVEIFSTPQVNDAFYAQTASELNELVEQQDAAMILFQVDDRKNIQIYLNLCRELRIPYLFLKSGQESNFKHIAVPVTLLEEDKEKAPFAASFGRFCNSKLYIVHPKDYGTKAERQIESFKKLFDSFHLNCEDIYSKKDSFKVEVDIIKHIDKYNIDMVIISASREYGLDDIIFGSKEKKAISKATCPILVINPRADLYALCD